MIRPDFVRFVRGLCDHYDAAEPKPERLDTTFTDVKHLSAEALPAIATYIRHTHDHFPRNLTKATLDAYELVKRGIPAKPEAAPEPKALTEADMESNRKRAAYWLPMILSMNATIRAPYLGDQGSRFGHDEPDAYHRTRRGR
jgi:hypothetical protein